MFGWSKDLVNWTAAEGNGLINEGQGTYNGFEFDELPINSSDIDTVAADAFVDPADNSVYMVVSAGYYGAFHGDAENDTMYPYLVKIAGLSINGYTRWTNDLGQYYPSGLSIDVDNSYCKKMTLSGGINSKDRIDGSLYYLDGTYYLSIKRDGIYNEIYTNTSMAPDGWTLIKDGLSEGSEGPCLVRFNNQWRLYTDRIATYNHEGINGMRVNVAKEGLTGDWSGEVPVIALTPGTAEDDGQLAYDPIHIRHGSVIYIDDADALTTIKTARSNAGWSSDSATPTIAFADVNTSTPHAGDIVWLAEQGVTEGWVEVNAREFRGSNTVVRQDMAAFLYRLANNWGIVSDEWKSDDWKTSTGVQLDYFSDVNEKTPHYKEILWLASTGVTTGWVEDSVRTFRGMNEVVRQDMAAFLHRLYDYAADNGANVSANETSSLTFSDVNSSTPHYEHILWLASTGISKGWNEGGKIEFRGMNSVVRQDMAAFLHRLDGLVE